MKFGGTSVADLDHIRNVARHVKREADAGNQIAVVVSAMAGRTNELVDLCRQAGALHDAREYDTVVAAGEQVTCGLLAIILQGLGIDARSWLGWQVPIVTDDMHGKAKIEKIETSEIGRRIDGGVVAPEERVPVHGLARDASVPGREMPGFAGHLLHVVAAEPERVERRLGRHRSGARQARADHSHRGASPQPPWAAATSSR